jgi:glycosyltransferase involved in cell wall biosynthesis
LVRFKVGDKVLVVTNPPLLPFLVTVATKIKKCASVLLVHDVYPEVLVAAGVLKTDSTLFKAIQALAHWLYNQVAAVVVIGRDMANIAITKCNEHKKIHLITNWADLDTVNPSFKQENNVLKLHRLLDSFVVQYCGNMGRTHGLEYILESAMKLKDDSIHFLLIGSGAKKSWLQKQTKDQSLSNVTILPRCTRDHLSEFLNACDLAIISFVPGMSGVSVPSRMYNIMASGKPILAITDSDSELSKVVKEENIGWVVTPGDINSIIEAITDAKSDLVRLKEMGERARKVAITKYSLTEVIKKYQELFDSL